MKSEPGIKQEAVPFDVELRDVSKTFGPSPAVRNLTLKVERGLFFSLLGPSGCGKTTTLRLIAGFETPSVGQILIRGVDVAGLPPYRRDVNTVFQSYALFPHMTVEENIGYGLRQHHLGRTEIRRRVGEALEMVRLSGTAKRKPAQLSGGQQQRVALARALINRPTVLLLDEPLSALDLKLRKEMQAELKALQHTVRITFIYVTHDQEEALTLSNRIAVINGGRVEQEGSPAEIYERPQTRFVADFIGLTNFFEGTVLSAPPEPPGETGSCCIRVMTAFGEIRCAGYQPAVVAGERVTVTLRPEKVQLVPVSSPTPDAWNCAQGVIAQATFLGAQNEYRVMVGDTAQQAMTIRQQNRGALGAMIYRFGADQESNLPLEAEWRVFGPGERVTLLWQQEACLLLREPGAITQHTESEETRHSISATL